MEQMPRGPVDVVYQLTDEALQLDDDLLCSDYTEEELIELREVLLDYDARNPYIDMIVEVTGRRLKPIFKGEEIIGGAFDQAQETSHGLYQGYTILLDTLVHDGEIVGEIPRMVHCVSLGKSQHFDELGNHITTEEMHYFLVRGAKVVPHEMHNTHSFIDLQSDDIAFAIDELVFNEDIPLEEKIVMLSEMFKVGDLDDDNLAMYRQRMSYLNSLDLLDGRGLITSVILADYQQDPLSFRAMASHDGSCYVASCWEFALIQGIEINGDKTELADTRGLFIRGYMEQLGDVLVPVNQPFVFEEH
jgi:hypothetical protein